ncbi:nucleotide sugar dehydrogenase [Desulfuribacillus alkaliarsenatis]|uniref:UDP-N-acetyl-D-glucosamine dehydrogenase n=1 Tax=Desulfuribacillus alkaliarsenatis TaxID=766136 RepID=A0A1E5G1W7_9FIRM|nr:nucleotide sugar dehydrogenase [Desulfuribacillus alkaliarsenatis]OEF96822.1 UDP-N-acetyl-D-glucosamine dehydrogenase [Desulfuribacillus alkaliarsenatis]
MSQITKEQNLLAKTLERVKGRTARLGVVGLGYVGLPLAVEKAKAGYEVIGFDVQQERIDMVNQGINYIGDVVDDELKNLVMNNKLQATLDYSYIKELDVVSICVPTPLDKYQQPNISYVQASTREIAKYMNKGTLVVLESTTYPGTTEEIVKPILESTGFICGEDFYLAYSPERVDPGNKEYNTKNTPKVVGGITTNCTKIAAAMYEQILEGEVHCVSSPAVAEMEKILENTFRNINIALVNEMAILCERMGIDIWEVIEAAKTKPYGFMAFYPGPGLGGHCIPIDPWYLTWKAREYNYHTRLIEVAGEINNSMPEFVVDRISYILNEHKKPINGSTVYLLGVAYKKDIDDYRESPVLKIIEILENRGAIVQTSDPFIDEFDCAGKDYLTTPLTKKALQTADIVVVTTDHSNFDYDLIEKEAKVIFDTRNVFPNKPLSNRYIKL